MEPNNSKEEIEKNEKIIVSKDEENSKIVDNLQDIENLSVDQLEVIISELKICKIKNNSIYFKYLVVVLSRKYKNNGKKLAANFATYSLSTIYDWEKQYDKLKAFRNQK